jgi:hypothetical protein
MFLVATHARIYWARGLKTAETTVSGCFPDPPSPLPTRPGWAEERSVKRKRARDCLSEASSSETPLGASTARCPERSAGTQTAGRLFLAYLILAKQKKVSRPPRRQSGTGTSQRADSTKHEKASIPQRERVWQAGSDQPFTPPQAPAPPAHTSTHTRPCPQPAPPRQ